MHNATFPTKTGKTDWASAVTGQGNLTGHQLLQVNVLRYTKKVRKRKPKYRANELQDLGHSSRLSAVEKYTPWPPNRRLPNRRNSKIVGPIFAQKVLENTCFMTFATKFQKKKMLILNFKIIFP